MVWPALTIGLFNIQGKFETKRTIPIGSIQPIEIRTCFLMNKHVGKKLNGAFARGKNHGRTKHIDRDLTSGKKRESDEITREDVVEIARLMDLNRDAEK